MSNVPIFDPYDVVTQFDLIGTPLEIAPYGSGHINHTFVSSFSLAGSQVRYIHQRINDKVFQKPDQLMDNIQRVLQHQATKIRAFGRPDPDRRAMTLIPGKDGRPFVRDMAGGWWRTYRFIERTKSYDVLQSADQAREISRAVGQFQLDMADFPAPRLHETIPRFHDAEVRYTTFRAVLEADQFCRAEGVRGEIEWFLAQEAFTKSIVQGLRSGKIPERITHNDTKANNILLDEVTGEGLCVIDLDTVMPGSLLYDFGDLVRTGTATAAEDATDSATMTMDISRFQGLAQGFCEVTRPVLVPAEKTLLPAAGRILTTIIGLRFLTDYLDGDHYYKTTRPGQNLDRLRTQKALVESIDSQMTQMIDLCGEA